MPSMMRFVRVRVNVEVTSGRKKKCAKFSTDRILALHLLGNINTFRIKLRIKIYYHAT